MELCLKYSRGRLVVDKEFPTLLIIPLVVMAYNHPASRSGRYSCSIKMNEAAEQSIIVNFSFYGRLLSTCCPVCHREGSIYKEHPIKGTREV